MIDIIVAPANAQELAVATAEALSALARDIVRALEEREYLKAEALRVLVAKRDEQLRDSIQTAQHGDLDVRALVLARIPTDFSWAGTFGVESTLSAFDARLGTRVADTSKGWRSRSVALAMIETLLDEGVLKRHGGARQVRRTKPGEAAS